MRCCWIVLLALLAACEPSAPPAPAASAAPPALREERLGLTPPDPQLPLLAAYRQELADAQRRDPPILPLPGLQAEAARAQELVLADPETLARARAEDGQPLRLQVFAVYPLRPTDQGPVQERCRGRACQRVEIYDFARNQALVTIVDPAAGEVLARGLQVDAQPEIPEAMKALAIELAVHAPEVAEALGGAPDPAQALMASTKTALNRTRCERSQHLCVAPTFVTNNVAIWAVVDLTDLQLVGVRWTDLGQRDDPPPTEMALQNAVLDREYCERSHVVEREGWQFEYGLTASDGLQVSAIRYRGTLLYDSVKLVDWHVNYSEREGFGYSDAIGCPTFSSAAVVPYAPPVIEVIGPAEQAEGFRLTQEFRSPGWPLPCNYSYRQGFEFYRDGRFRPTIASIGAGCGNDGTYRPVLRIALGGDAWQSRAFDGRDFAAVDREGWFEPGGPVDAQQTRLRLQQGAQQIDVVEGRGQFGDGGRGDQAWLYLTRRHADRDEGDTDLLTIGPCCNLDHRQGPDKYIEDPPEALAGRPVLWYVPQLKNDDRPGQQYCWADHQLVDGVFVPRAYPCVAGPLLHWRGPLSTPES